MIGPLLVVAHEGYRNGATRVLADLLAGLRAEVDRPLRIRVLRDGPLTAELVAHDDDPGPSAPPSAVLLNSVLALGALAEVEPGVPVVLYAHEVGEGLRAGVGPHLALLRDRVDHVACVSERASRDLVALGVRPERVSVVAPTVARRVPDPVAVAAARRRCGAGPGQRLVLGCGEATWRKGTDHFVALAAVLRERPDVHLAWVGRRHRSFARHLDADAALVGVDGSLTWVGELDDALPALAVADLLVLSSREDPQPLVPLEAATVGTATVGFGGTGLDDLVHRGAAVAVPYPDVAALAAAVTALLADSARTDALARAAAEVADRDRSPAAAAHRLGAMICRLPPPAA